MAYSKQTWDTTSYVNPTRMNHIEDGIYNASSKIYNLFHKETITFTNQTFTQGDGGKAFPVTNVSGYLPMFIVLNTPDANVICATLLNRNGVYSVKAFCNMFLKNSSEKSG